MQYIRNKDYNNNNDDDDDDDDETVIQMKCLTCDISLKSEKQREEKFSILQQFVLCERVGWLISGKSS